MSRSFDSPEALVDALVGAVGNDIVLGLPVGIGKAIHVADALYARAADDPSLRLTIFTGLTLETPAGNSELEKRFLGPLVDRLYGQWPTPAYATDLRHNALPANVKVREFYLRPGAYLGNPLAQQSYSSINYSQVADELMRLGVNVVAQLVAVRAENPGRYSLGSNPEVTLDLLPRFDERRRRGGTVAMIAQVNGHMPYMTGDADIAAERFDFVLDADACDFPLFALPNRSVAPADYAVGMHVASLIPDGGTLQIGIGSLSDAVAHCLRLRHESPSVFADILDRLPGGTRSPRRSALPVERHRFDQGLFASTELLSDALYSLFETGLITRPADADDEALIHAGFFIGSTQLYEGLRSLSESRRRLINMTRISWVNTLFGDEQRKRRQRLAARFINETMMVTLLGAAISDALDDGRVVSGVGGQFDFVSMAHALEDAYSILMCRASRIHKGALQSNVRWSYAHTTVPRHHRDIVVSEYGIAATRGQTDSQVIGAMLAISDSTFQNELADQAIRAGKLDRSYELPADARHNTPRTVASIFADSEVAAHFPAYPLGTDLTPAEQQLAAALQWLKVNTATAASRLITLLRSVPASGGREFRELLSRMQLDEPATINEFFMRRLLLHAIRQTKQ